MQNRSPKSAGRRALLKGTAMLAVAATAHAQNQPPAAQQTTTLADVPIGPSVTITVERRGDIVLVGLNRPFIQNRLDPPTRARLAATFFQYEHDPSLRALVLFGHGENFSRGIDVDASQAGIIAGQRAAPTAPAIDVLGNGQPRRSKPVVVVVHGDTWNLGHEIYLAGDVRVAAANTRFGQDENTHGRFPGGGATVRFVREAGLGQRDALHADRRSLDRRGVVPHGHHAADRADARGRARSRRRDRAKDRGVRTAVDQGDARIGAPVCRPGRSRRAVEARRAVQRALPHRRLHRRPACGSRRPAAEVPGKVSVSSSALGTRGKLKVVPDEEAPDCVAAG